MDEERCVMCGEVIPEGDMVCRKCIDKEPSFDTVKINVCLNKITDISKFIELAYKCQDDVVIKSGRFVVNAKSIMGIFSLDLSKPVQVEFYGDVPYEVKQGMKEFIVD